MVTRPAMGLESVGESGIYVILSKLGPSEAAILACVNKRFKDWASDELMWSSFCAQELNLSSSPVDPLGNPCPSFKAAYGAWREAYVMYPWSLVRRVKNVWDRIRSWLTENFPEVLPTLRKGASEDEIKELERCLKVKLPLPTRVLYRFCDGQESYSDALRGSMLRNICGLIGGYSFYDHVVNVFLLPLDLVIKETKDNAHDLRTRPKCIAVASSGTRTAKQFFLDCEEGQLYVGTRKLTIYREMMPCVPNGLITSVHDSRSGCQQDAMLLWLEEHARRLEAGNIKLRDERNVRSISQLPQQPPLCSLATACGVEVRASAVFLPEFSTAFPHEAEKLMFAYSVCMSLKPGGCVIGGTSFDSCQMYRRHCIIKESDNVVEDINRKNAKRKHLLLHPGQKKSVIETYTTSSLSSGSIEGSLTFIPGRVRDRKGNPFEVEIARFPLLLPEYIF